MFPEIQSFLQNHAQDFPLELRNVRGAYPKIMMLNSDGTVNEEVSIDKWSNDQIRTYLEERLVPISWWSKLVSMASGPQMKKQLPMILLLLLSLAVLLINVLSPQNWQVYQPGQKVVVHGLQKGQQYNGRAGIVVTEEDGRYVVRLLEKGEAVAEELQHQQDGGGATDARGGSGEQEEGKEDRVEEPNEAEGKGRGEGDGKLKPKRQPKLLKVREANIREWDELDAKEATKGEDTAAFDPAAAPPQ